jgi:hypothetical protein
MTDDMRRLAKQVEGLAPQLDDKQLLEQIVVTIDYLLAKWDRHSPLFRSSDPEDVIHALEDSALPECRDKLVRITELVAHLGQDLRDRAERSMVVKPMTCFTIEALGGVMSLLGPGNEIIVTTSGVGQGAIEKLQALLRDVEELVESAVMDIVRDDLPELAPDLRPPTVAGTPSAQAEADGDQDPGSSHQRRSQPPATPLRFSRPLRTEARSGCRADGRHGFGVSTASRPPPGRDPESTARPDAPHGEEQARSGEATPTDR